MSPIKAKASSLAPGMRLFKGCLSCLGNLNPTCDANLYPSAHSSFVGVPFMDLIIMSEKRDKNPLQHKFYEFDRLLKLLETKEKICTVLP